MAVFLQDMKADKAGETLHLAAILMSLGTIDDSSSCRLDVEIYDMRETGT